MYRLSIGHYQKQQVVMMIALVIMVVFTGYWLEQHITAVENWLANLGHWAGVGFIILFVLLTPLFVSVDALCIIAGALFSLSSAISYVLIATMIAAAVIFYIGRYLARDKIQPVIQKHPGITRYAQLIEAQGFKIMFMLRLLPLPFALLSYVFATSRAAFLPYWLATTGIFFYNAALVYFGYTAAHFTDQVTQGNDYSGPHNIFLVGGVLGCILVMGMVAKIARAQLDTALPDDQDM